MSRTLQVQGLRSNPLWMQAPVGMFRGLDVGLARETIDAYFSPTEEPYRLYGNHKPAKKYQDILDKIIEEP